MNNLDKQYQSLLQDILDNGVKKEDRTGTGTLSVFGRQIRHKMSEGFPLLTTKKMAWKSIVTELLWFLRGDTNIKYLVDNDCHIWDGDAYKNYVKVHAKKFREDTKELRKWAIVEGPFYHGFPTKEEFINKIKTDDKFAKKWGELGPIYGKQWRKWGSFNDKRELVDGGRGNIFYAKVSYDGVDQIANLISELKTNPDSRRLMVSAWNVGELNQMVLPPCHYGFQVYTRELSNGEMIKIVEERVKNHQPFKNEDLPTRAISLMWNQRSVDTFLGLPFNIASYGLLLEIIAKEVNMVPDELIGNLGDVHLYSNHVDQAKEQIGRKITEEEILEHLQQSGMDALMYDARMEYISKLPKHTRQPYPLPKLVFEKNVIENIFLQEKIGRDNYNVVTTDDFQIENYQSHPPIKAPLSN